MAQWTLFIAMTVALLFAGNVTLFAQDLTIQITNCPKTVKAGQNLNASFRVEVGNNGDTAVKDVALEFVLKKNAGCTTPARHALYAPGYFDGVLLREGRESVSLAPKQKMTLSPHGMNTIPSDIPVGRTYFICAVLITGDKVQAIDEKLNCSCCPIKVVGIEERPVITGYGETCISRRGTVTIIGRNFGSAEGKIVSLAGAGVNVNLSVLSWSDSGIIARIPDDANIRAGRRYYADIRKAAGGELLSNTGVYISVCPEQKAMPESGPNTPPVSPFFYQ
jgi:hypothetical protein